MKNTTRKGLEERQDTPQVLTTSEESLNSMSLTTPLTKRENSMPLSHLGCGYNPSNRGGVSAKHNVFVLGVDGKPLTPTTNAKARKLMEGKQAKPVWNKFSQFGIQMLVNTRKETPKTALGVDFGTKFEGYAVVTGKENSLSTMWKLPDKKKIVRKLEERRALRRTKRHRNCRRRECRFDNRTRPKGWLSPSQLMMVQSRIKAINEFFKCYPIHAVAMEDVCFNHRDNRWGKNFSTIEHGKTMINGWIRKKAELQFFKGTDTESCRERYDYKKSRVKNAEVFNSHCSDALAIATDIYAQEHIEKGKFIVVDDTYRPVRRKLHYLQPAKGGVRNRYSSGNFRGIRKGTICNFGQMCGGTGKHYYMKNQKNKRINRINIAWLSHNLKTQEGKT
jgi:RRXRR protein